MDARVELSSGSCPVDPQSGLGETDQLGMGGRQLPLHPSKADVCLSRTYSVSLPLIVASDRVLTLPLWLKHVLMGEEDDTKTPQETPRYNCRDISDSRVYPPYAAISLIIQPEATTRAQCYATV